MHFRRILCLAGAAGSLATTPAAFAQTAGGSLGDVTATPAQGAHVPVKATRERKLDLNLGFLTTYDDNVARSSDTIARTNGLKSQDVYFAPYAAVDISLPFGRSVAHLSGSTSYQIYARNSRLNGERLALDGGLSSDFGRCNAALDGSINRARTNVIDLVAQGAGIGNFETISSGDVTVSCGGVVGLQPFAEFNYERGTNTNFRRKGSDYRTLTYGGGISYVQPSIGEIGVIGSIQDTDYTARDGSTGTFLSGIKSFPTRSIGVFYTRDVTRFFTAKARVNYTNVDVDVGRSYSGVTGEASVKIAPSERFNVEVAAYRAAAPSLTFNVDYAIETGASISSDYQFSQRLGATLSYAYIHRRYHYSDANLAFPLTNDNDNLFNGELNYKLNRRIALTFGAIYELRRANGTFYDFDALRLLAGIRGAF